MNLKNKIISLLSALFLLSSSVYSAEKLKVVATTGMLADAVKNIVGDKLLVTGLMGQGVDPHLYKASPQDLRSLLAANLVIYNGLHLEGRMGEILEKLGEKKTVVGIGDTLPQALLREAPGFQGAHDPHIWFDVSIWAKGVEIILEAIIKLDQTNADHYRKNAQDFNVKLKSLHEFVITKINSIPKEKRVLITAHDAFGYFGRAYGVEVLGIQGVSTESEASIMYVNKIVAEIVQRKIPAVFVESSVPKKTVEALLESAASKGHILKVGGELFSDAMGSAGTDEGTYIGMVKHNVNIIVEGLR